MKNGLRIDALIARLMRIARLQLILSFLFAGTSIAGSGSEQEILDEQITLDVKNQSLKSILNRIEKSVEVKFAYSKDAIDSFEKVSIKAEDERSVGVTLSNHECWPLARERHTLNRPA